MKLFLHVIFFLASMTSLASFADASATPDKDSKLIAKSVMGGVYESFLKIIPYVYSSPEEVLALKSSPEKKAELIKNLKDISDYFKGAKHIEYFKRPGFKPSLESMNQHLSETLNSMSTNNFSFAQKRLSALTTLCVSCHSQLSSSGAQNAFGNSLQTAKRDDFANDYAFANYLYLIRRFDDSEVYFHKALDYAVANSQGHEIFSSLRRVISIHTKIKYDFKKANLFIDKFLAANKLPVLAKNMLTSWKSSLKSWENFDPTQMKSVEDFIKTHLTPLEEIREQTASGDNDMSLLIASGVLSKYLNDNPKTQLAPQILYWLSIAEKRLGNTYFFTLSELYLKDCIQLYPKNQFAKKCFGLYEDNINFGYSGSSGTDIPIGEKRELARLKAFIK